MKKNGFGFIAMFITLALSGGVATATGCGGVATSSLCEDICACQRCTSNDLKSCQDQGENAADRADAAGCSSQFEAALTCVSTHVTCEKDEAVVARTCDAEQEALAKCSITFGVLGKNACERATDILILKLKRCGLTPTRLEPTKECTAALGAKATCEAACFDAADCTTFNSDLGDPTPNQLQSVLDCLDTCPES